jgi:RNA polymerase sigma-70 factor (ECF subfamily)
LEEVKRAIEELPLPYREAFTLFYLEERTYEEMIDILKKPKGTIASLLSRAKKLLQERLAHHAPLV